MNATETNWRGFTLTRDLLKRGCLPLLNPQNGTIMLYRTTGRAQLSYRELADVWRERAALGEYLKGLK